MWEEVDRAEVVIHAGDWMAPSLLDDLEARAARLIACWGNNDGTDLRARLPERADATLGGVRFTVTHETGARAGREARMSRRYPDTDVLVFGHSHIPWDTTSATGLRLLNPGSPPTGAAAALHLHDGDRRRRHALRRAPAPPALSDLRAGAPTATRRTQIDRHSGALSGSDECGRIRMLGRVEQFRGASVLDDAPLLHDDYALASSLDESEVVGDVQNRYSCGVGEIADQVDHVAAQRRIKHPGGLVGKYQPGPGHQRPGKRDALPLSAGELVRIPGEVARI